jgi:ureidoglycolate hydrolase
MSSISRGLTSHHTGTVPLCSTTGGTSSIERTSIPASSNVGQMSSRTIVLVAEPLTPESFAPFGALPSDEGTEHDVADVEFLLADGHVNYIRHVRHEVPSGDVGLRCELLNRHDTHTQTLMPVDGDAVVVVAPSAVDFDEPAHVETVRAFFVERGRCVHLWRGTWHWGPFPVVEDAVRLLNVQGRRYTEDNVVADLARDCRVVFEVDVGASASFRARDSDP